jgi:hypothetical protein
MRRLVTSDSERRRHLADIRHKRPTLQIPGVGVTCRFAAHKTNTTPGSREDQHGNNTDKTVLPGTQRHAC